MTDRLLADFYDAESEGADELGPDVDLLRARLPDRPLDVLEVGCGTGRVVAALADDGHRVVGIDSDPDMLAVARRRVPGADLREADAAGDAVNGTFDLATLMFSTFAHFATPDRQARLLKNLHTCLRPGGTLWIDAQNPDLALLVEAQDGVEDLHPIHFRAAGRDVMRTTSVQSDLTGQVAQIRFDYHWFENGRERRAARSFDAGWTMPRELARLLTLAGFEVRGMWGDYDGSGVADDSPRLIVEAVRSPDA